MLRRALIAAADSSRLKDLASRAGPTRDLARRFVAGEQLAEAMDVTERLVGRGFAVTLDHLGESVTEPAVARRAADMYGSVLTAIGDRGLARGPDRTSVSVSVKPSQLGLQVGVDLCRELIAGIARQAADVGTHVTIDMEGSEHTQATIDLVTRLRADGHDNVGCAVQAYLHRTPDDVTTLTGGGASLRLCKGAYAEPDDIAWQSRDRIRTAFLDCVDLVFDSGTYGRFATHDDWLIHRILNAARRRVVDPERFELQMLYGVREPLQDELLASGHAVRIYVPFGQEWYPYLVRRLAERPANLLFFLRAVAGRRSPQDGVDTNG